MNRILLALTVLSIPGISFLTPDRAHAQQESAASSPLLPFMPKVPDYTYMWWAEGFPGNREGAPWLRVIQTGNFAFVLNTKTLAIPHFGPLETGADYPTALQWKNAAWSSLPPAELDLRLTVDGKEYHHSGGGEWTRHGGPRLIESGRFFQRSDVTGIPFVSADGKTLNVEARFETSAWADRLGVLFGARPGMKDITIGEDAFGRVGGGFGLDGKNHFEIPHRPEVDPEKFTLEFWAFFPVDFASATRAIPWLACKNRHEQAEGNYGIVMHGDRPEARLNIGGGRENSVSLRSEFPVRKESWNHLVLSYDGDILRLFLNNRSAGEVKVGKARVPGGEGLAFGRRQDGSGDGYHFRGVIDEIHIYPRALTAREVSYRFHHPEKKFAAVAPLFKHTFREEGKESLVRPRETWGRAAMQISLRSGGDVWKKHRELPNTENWSENWEEIGFSIDPETRMETTAPNVQVSAADKKTGRALEVDFDPAHSHHRLVIDGIEPFQAEGENREPGNDELERIQITLRNQTNKETTARLLFQKNAGDFRKRFGFPITGISAVLRDRDGYPTGIPVQLSKNWHISDEAGLYSGTWFHGFSQIHLPPGAKLELELTIAYGHWGGLPAASHAQLSLIGWGTNQLWDQSALGSWGESICYEPDQIQGKSAITDVRPLMVRAMKDGGQWAWTRNVGGGDFFRTFDAGGNWIPPSRMRTAYHRQGPCLTEVTYAGKTGSGISRSTTVSISRSDDLVRGTYRLRLDVKEPTDISRFVIFQVGSDTYNTTAEKKMALGNEEGLVSEWATTWGEDSYRTARMEATGRIPWVSLHESVERPNTNPAGARANRGIVIRSWDARLGGKKATPWVAERGVSKGNSSIIDLLPPPEVAKLEAGDYVDAIVEHLIVPQFGEDYYGPNRELRSALKEGENTWKMIFREATGNDRQVEIQTGKILGRYPAVTIQAEKGNADFTIRGGLGYVPVTISGLDSPGNRELVSNDSALDQSIHGNDFWQTDFDPLTRLWSLTFNVPSPPDSGTRFQLRPKKR
jgi:hypothetical protein